MSIPKLQALLATARAKKLAAPWASANSFVMRNDPWRYGGCDIVAHAIHELIPGSSIVGVRNQYWAPGRQAHLAVKHGSMLLDAYGGVFHESHLPKFHPEKVVEPHNVDMWKPRQDHPEWHRAKADLKQFISDAYAPHGGLHAVATGTTKP